MAAEEVWTNPGIVTGVGFLAVLIYLTRDEDSLWRQCLIIAIVGAAVFRAMFLSSLMGRGKESEEKMDTRNKALQDFESNRAAVQAKYAKKRADEQLGSLCAGSGLGMAAELSAARLERTTRLEAADGAVRSFDVKGLASPVLVSEKPGFKLGSVTWDGARILSQMIPSAIVAGRRNLVCELGSGTGMCGVTAALCGAHCLLSDKVGEVTTIMAATIALNAEGILSAGGSAEAMELSWGDTEASGRALAWAAAQPARRGGHFDLILGADVVYHVDLVEPLVRTLEELCPAGCPARILLAYRERGAGSAFLAAARRAGFHVCVRPQGGEGAKASGGAWRAMYALRMEAEVASEAAARPSTAAKKYHVSTEHVILELSRGKPEEVDE